MDESLKNYLKETKRYRQSLLNFSSDRQQDEKSQLGSRINDCIKKAYLFHNPMKYSILESNNAPAVHKYSSRSSSIEPEFLPYINGSTPVNRSPKQRGLKLIRRNVISIDSKIVKRIYQDKKFIKSILS